MLSRPNSRIFVDDNVYLTLSADDGVMEIGSGTIFELGEDAVVNMATPVDVAGTNANPVRFIRSGANPWREVRLTADGSTFEGVVFDGGTKTVEVTSKNNTFVNCRFKNGWRGISSGYTSSGHKSSFELVNTIIEGNATVGVVAYHADVDIIRATIDGNGQAGIWAYDSSINPMERTLVENNGAT